MGYKTFLENYFKEYYSEYEYVTSCVDAKGCDIEDMVDNAEEVDYEEFMDAVGQEQVEELFSFYDWSDNPESLTLKDDYAVSYYKGKYKGEDCYFIQHSAIEYVFVKK